MPDFIAIQFESIGSNLQQDQKNQNVHLVSTWIFLHTSCTYILL